MSFKIDLGRNIAAARREAGLKQIAVARQIGSSHASVSRWESGERMPNAKVLRMMSTIYNKSIDDLVPYVDEDDMKPYDGQTNIYDMLGD